MDKRNNNYIVDTNTLYTYSMMTNDILALKNRYSFLEIGNIGYSVLGKTIPYVRIGTGEKEVLYSASFHANEWITTVVLMKFIEDFCISYEQNSSLYNEYNSREIFNSTSIYLVPMVNPDGVDLLTDNIDKNSNIYQNFLSISKNFPAIPFPSGWKANFNGVVLKRYQPDCKVL